MKENRRDSAPLRDRMAKHNKTPDKPKQSDEPARAIPKYRQCPCCYEGRGGVGRPGWWRRINGSLVKRQYICNVCGMDWTVEERTHSVIQNIQYTEVEVKHGEPPDLETR